MGGQGRTGAQFVSEPDRPPTAEELELTVLGPGYGESMAIHFGNGEWAIVDSFLDPDGTPAARRYLESIGVCPAEAVALIVATHWHDDHIRGIAQLVELCPSAQFCCASVLCDKEFLTLIGTLEGNHFSASGSGLRELHRVFSRLGERKQTPIHALANRLLLRRPHCEVWSLSPSDRVFQGFLRTVGKLAPPMGSNKTKLPNLSPNETAVVLSVESRGCSLLLGADLEKHGWVAIVEDDVRRASVASVFKVPHHGSMSAHETTVWEEMLNDEPVAILTPWRRGRGVLPTTRDAQRILGSTPNAWITNQGLSGQADVRHEDRAVEKTLRESGVRIRRLAPGSGFVRFRQSVDADDHWTVESFGTACHLSEYAA